MQVHIDHVSSWTAAQVLLARIITDRRNGVQRGPSGSQYFKNSFLLVVLCCHPKKTIAAVPSSSDVYIVAKVHNLQCYVSRSVPNLEDIVRIVAVEYSWSRLEGPLIVFEFGEKFASLVTDLRTDVQFLLFQVYRQHRVACVR